MESIAQQKRIRIDIDGRTAVVTGKDDLYQGDSYANEIVVEVLRDGKAADLSGYTASGEMQRSDEAKVPCEGSVNGNIITITLNPHCYKEAGSYMLSVRLSKSAEETTRTVLRIYGEVQRAANGPTVDISETLVNVDAVLALYEEMKTATREAEEAAENAKNLPAINTDGFWELWDAALGEYVATLRRSMPDFTFQAKTGAPGTNVQLVQTGTPDAPVITLTIPRGDTGAVEGIDYFAGDPSALGEASPGTANGVARGDHVHPLPSAETLQVLSYAAQALSAAQKLQALTNAGAVGYDVEQALTEEQRAQARENIGSVGYEPQSLTDEQKQKARENIGAGTPDSYTLPTATADTLGGVKLGSAFAAPGGVLTIDGEPAELVTFIERATYSKNATIQTLIPLDADAFYLVTFRGQGIGVTYASKTSDGVSYIMKSAGFVTESITGTGLVIDIAAFGFAGNGATSSTLSFLNRYNLSGTSLKQSSPVSLDIGPVYMIRKLAQ